MVRFDEEEVQAVVQIASKNPSGFLKLVKKYCTTVSVDEVKRSMRAWDIHVPDANDHSTNNRTANSRQNNNNRRLRR